MQKTDKIMSTLQKDINRLKGTCARLDKSNTLRKHQITQFNLLVKKLLSEGRITKDEISEFIEKKENVKL